MTSSNVDLRNYVISRQHFIKYPPKPPGVGWVNLFLGENKSRIYPHMRANYGRGPTVVSKKGGVQTHRVLHYVNFLMLRIATAVVWNLSKCVQSYQSHFATSQMEYQKRVIG